MSAWPNGQALLTAVAAYQALEAIGMPEARLRLPRRSITVCESQKSNSVSNAMGCGVLTMRCARRTCPCRRICAIRFTRARRVLGSGAGYQLSARFSKGILSYQQYMPTTRQGGLLCPGELGNELNVRKARQLRKQYGDL
jgi:putative ATPase